MQGQDDLAIMAARWGLEPGFHDARGQFRRPDEDTLRRVLIALSHGGKCEPADRPAGTRRHSSVAFQGDGRRVWVLAVQLYAVRSQRNWGHGDFTDLCDLVALAADIGAAGIGLNPLHALFTDDPGTASPYSPNSRLFLNPLYIDVEAVPEFEPDEAYTIELARLRATEFVDYAGVARMKLDVLRRAHRRFTSAPQSERTRDLDAFRAECGPALARFAAFEVLRQRFRTEWWNWPDGFREPGFDLIETLRGDDEFVFQEFLQWIADRQLAACRDSAQHRGMAIGLYVDLAVGVDPSGADAWSEQDAMLHGLSVGAPPDLLNTVGQDWGLTTLDPRALIERDFAPLRALSRATMRYAGAIRIDHVLGLNRLYLVPHGMSATSGVYLRFPFDDMLAVIAEESNANHCIVIGEDLGTVPDGFRERLQAAGLWRYLVMLFEREHDGAFRTPERYPASALATFSTHDLPTYAGWRTGHDLAVKRAIGIDPGETDAERAAARDALARAVPHGRSDPVPRFRDVVRYLAATPCRLMVVSVEDVLDLVDQINIPGTVRQNPNWCRRLPVMLADLAVNAALHDIAGIMKDMGRAP